MLLKSVDRVSLGCGKASAITMTEMCGSRSHPLKIGLHFLELCIRYVSLDDRHGRVHRSWFSFLRVNFSSHGQFL